MPLKLADFVKEEERGKIPNKTTLPLRAPIRTGTRAPAGRNALYLPGRARRARRIVDRFLWLGLSELRSEMRRAWSPWRFLRIGRRIAARILARLFGRDFRYARLALRMHVSLRLGLSAHAKGVAGKLVTAAPNAANRALACDLLEAAEANNLERAARIETHARQFFGRGEGAKKLKIVSRKYRFFWLANLKVASRSIIQALHSLDPEAEVFLNSSVDDILLLQPQVRDYFSFAFVRNPFHRSVSLYSHMFLRESNLDWGSWQSSYHGLSTGMDFESFCAWLASPYGADEFADPHWLSQHLQIVMSGHMPDFVGRLETIEGDSRTIARMIGLPGLHLSHRNTIVGKVPKNRKDVATAQHAAEAAHLTDRARQLLRRRYADDFRIFGYDPE